MTNSIEVVIKTKYGNPLIYPHCKTAKLFCKLLHNQLTLTEQNIADIKALGYTVHVVSELPATL